MKASLIDRGKYFRGLLVLIGRDRIIDPRERALMVQIGKILDFDRRFCETAIANLLGNKYISDEPILFDEQLIAECFLKDALKLAIIDGEIHSNELSWMTAVARTNNLTASWFDGELQNIRKTQPAEVQPELFEIHRFI